MTAQVSDDLLFEGEVYRLLCEPLETYFEQNPPRPKIEATCTACWRGYVATWRIKRSSKLYLEQIEGFDGEQLALKKHLFPQEEGLVFATWFSGPLICPNGDEKDYVHMGYETIYDSYIIIEILNGNVQNILDLSHTKFVEWQKQNR